MLLGTLSALTGVAPDRLRMGAYAAALGSALVAYHWYTTETVPAFTSGTLATEFKWDPQTSHAGEIVAAVLKQHGITYVAVLF